MKNYLKSDPDPPVIVLVSILIVITIGLVIYNRLQ